jgi:hypothetical protein
MTAALWLAAFALQSPLHIRWNEVEADPRQPSIGTTTAISVVRDLSPMELEARAASEFELGKSLRSHAAQARPHFRAAAAMYDELWRRGFRDPAVALNRAHSRRLVGDLPAAIVALNDGLARARWNRPLQVALEEARSAVAYPAHSDLASLCRPISRTTIGMRMAPFEAQMIAGVVWLLACCGIARFAMTRAIWWIGFVGVWFVVLAALGALWLHDELSREDIESRPIVVIAQDVLLRKGNADSFPPRLEGPSRLPAGVEARELTRRGGWVQVRVAAGIIGWVPETVVLKTGD